MHTSTLVRAVKPTSCRTAAPAPFAHSDAVPPTPPPVLLPLILLLVLVLPLVLLMVLQAGMLGAAGAERSVYLTEPRKWRVVSKWPGATRLAIHSLSFLDTDPHCAVLAGLDLEVVCGRWDAPGSNARPFESSRPADEAAAAASSAGGAAAGGGGGKSEGQAGSGDKAHKPAALGAPGSGDRSRRGAPAAAAAAGGGGVGMDVDDGEGSAGGSGGVLSFRGDGRWLGVAKAAGEDVLAGFAASGNLVYAHIA